MKRISILLLLLSLQGCSLFYPQPKQNFYALSVPHPGSSGSVTGPVLCVTLLQINPLYENQGFVYHLSDSRTESDYYHLFLTAPEINITEQMKAWLRKSGHFHTVTGSDQLSGAAWILSGHIDTLYGDFTNPRQPVAVVAIRLYLTSNSGLTPESRISIGHFEKRVPLTENSPKGLIVAWNKALSEIFSEMEHPLVSAMQ